MFKYIALTATVATGCICPQLHAADTIAASATIAAQILRNFDFTWPQIISLLMSALAAGLTVGGKAIGKSFAVNSCTSIVHGVGRVIHALRSFPKVFRKKKKK